MIFFLLCVAALVHAQAGLPVYNYNCTVDCNKKICNPCTSVDVVDFVFLIDVSAMQTRVFRVLALLTRVAGACCCLLVFVARRACRDRRRCKRPSIQVRASERVCARKLSRGCCLENRRKRRTDPPSLAVRNGLTKFTDEIIKRDVDARFMIAMYGVNPEIVLDWVRAMRHSRVVCRKFLPNATTHAVCLCGVCFFAGDGWLHLSRCARASACGRGERLSRTTNW